MGLSMVASVPVAWPCESYGGRGAGSISPHYKNPGRISGSSLTAAQFFPEFGTDGKQMLNGVSSVRPTRLSGLYHHFVSHMKFESLLMYLRLAAVVPAVLIMLCMVALPTIAADDDSAKYSTKDIMKKAFKGPLLKKVAGGGASDAEKKQLHSMLVALSKNKPKKGDAESWTKLTGALVKASEAAVKGDSNAGQALKKAANCKACHNNHK